LASDREGAETLLELVTSGLATARLLLKPSVAEKLRASRPDRIDERLEELTADLPSEDEELRRLIEDRRRAYAPSGAGVAAGAALFEKNCALCHQIAGEGADVGPPLDGIGARGLERVLEDVLEFELVVPEDEDLVVTQSRAVDEHPTGNIDAVLVADMEAGQNVRDAVGALKAAGVGQAEDFPRFHRPWGWYETLSLGARFQVKRIMVKPGGILSLQSHVHRAEHWVVVEGSARVTIGADVKLITENQSVYIPLGTVHRLENPGKVELHLIEVQTGAYLGEDDITRYEDIYARV
ncbi:MAG: cupin domain-containing protein, partial [Paracoccaceae bacterium]